MENTYNQYKGQTITYPDCTLIICGYNDDHLIGATTLKPLASFRKVNKSTFIEEEYKQPQYKYVYIDESAVLKQLKNAVI